MARHPIASIDLAITAWPDVTTTVCCNASRNSTNCTPRPPNPATTETSRLSCFRIVAPSKDCLGCVLLQRFSRMIQPNKEWQGTASLPSISPSRPGPMSRQLCASMPAETRPIVLPGRQIQPQLIQVVINASLMRIQTKNA